MEGILVKYEEGSETYSEEVMEEIFLMKKVLETI